MLPIILLFDKIIHVHGPNLKPYQICHKMDFILKSVQVMIKTFTY